MMAQLVSMPITLVYGDYNEVVFMVVINYAAHCIYQPFLNMEIYFDNMMK